jgi:hypothetical protein
MNSKKSSTALSDYLRSQGVPVDADGGFMIVDGKFDRRHDDAFKRMLERCADDRLRLPAPGAST